MIKTIVPALVICIGLAQGLQAQQKTPRTAIIKMKTEVTFPERPGGGAGGDGDQLIGPGGGGMESATTAWYREDLVKTESKSDFGNNITIIDKKAGKTTTLMEAMGRKSGWYSDEAEQAKMQARMDSMRQARRDSLRNAGQEPRGNARTGQLSEPLIDVAITEETRKIAGYTCKKAIVKTAMPNGNISESIVWFTPDFNLPPDWMSTGGNNRRGGFGMGAMMMPGPRELARIPGFPMAYEMQRGNGFRISMEVTKVDLDPKIEDKVFEIPKGYDIKPMSEVMNGRGGTGQFMIRRGE